MCSGGIYFTQAVYTVTVNETAPPDYPRPTQGFITVSCVSALPNITYTMGNCSHQMNLPFEIDPNTGQLNATADIDYDSQDDEFEFYSFNVCCKDIIADNSTALVLVHINPINEFKPNTRNRSILLVINETTPSGTLLLSSLPGGLKMITVEDTDQGPHGEINFTLLSNSLDDHFTFDPLHASLTLVRTIDFDIEDNITYHKISLEIRVCDATTPVNACRIINVVVFVVPSDDNQPMFLRNVYTAALNETTTLGSTVLTLECSDSDMHYGEISSISMLDPSPEVEDTFSLYVGNSNDSIQVILASRLDYDRLNRTYQFRVSCNDTLHSTTANVSISVLPENDEEPTFTTTHYQFSTSQTTPLSAIVGQVTATDSDIDSGLPVSYAIHHPAPGPFSIDSVTGEIAVSTSLQNLIAFSAVLLNISASDGEFETHAQVTVTITPGNFHPPLFLQENMTVVMVNEAIEEGVQVINLTCTDRDTGPGRNITYFLSPANHNFSIDPVTGIVSAVRRVLLPFNCDTIQEYQLIAHCRDHGTPAQVDEIVVIIQVYCSDDIPPTFINLTNSTEVSEAAEVGYRVLNLTASDADTYTLNFTIVTQTLPGTFSLERIDSKSSTIRLQSFLDYEHTAAHLVKVEVVELRQVPGEPQRDTVEITVSVVDENDNSPQLIHPQNMTLYITDQEPNGTLLTSILCQDADSGLNSELIYNIHTTMMESQQMLRIDNNGRLTVAGSLLLPDFVLTTSYSVDISCTDSGEPPLTSSDNATLFVHITKLDVKPPVFNETNAILKIPENTTWPIPVYMIEAHDVDSPGIAYNINSDYPTPFTLNSTTAELILSASLDRETTPIYIITLIVMEIKDDGSHGNMTLTNLTIYVLDINDNTPTFLNPLKESISLPDTAPPGHVLHSVECRDEDDGSNGEITYEILPQHHLFAVDANGSILVTMPLNLPDFTLSDTHNVFIQCRDQAVPPLTASKALSITITKTNMQVVTKESGLPLIIIIILAVVMMLVLVAVVSGGGLCCYWCRIHKQNRRKKYFIRYSITIIISSVCYYWTVYVFVTVHVSSVVQCLLRTCWQE